jgi:hypothetical protein
MQDGEMLGYGGSGEPQQFRDLTHTKLPTAQGQQHPHPARVGQRLRNGHELMHRSFYISLNSEMNLEAAFARRNFIFLKTSGAIAGFAIGNCPPRRRASPRPGGVGQQQLGRAESKKPRAVFQFMALCRSTTRHQE